MGSVPPGVQVQCSITSSLGEFLGYWTGSGILGSRPYWCPSPFPSPSISLCFSIHSALPAIGFHCVSSLRLMHQHPSVDPSLTHFLGELSGLGLALVPDVVVPEAEQGVHMKQKSRFKFLPWPGFEPRTLQTDGRKRYH